MTHTTEDGLELGSLTVSEVESIEVFAVIEVSEVEHIEVSE